MEILNNASLLILAILFDLYIFILMLRFLSQCVQADYYNPIVQLSIKFTQPIIKPISKLIPRYKNIDWFVIIIMLILESIKNFLAYNLAASIPFAFNQLIIWSVASLANKFINFYFYAIIFHAILTWVIKQPTPLTILLHRLTEPMLRPLRRIIPPFHGFDLSPLLAIIILTLISIFIIYPFLHGLNT